MKRPLAAAFLSAVLIAMALPSLAQLAPSDTGAGVERGMQELNTSGQVGTVTLFGRGAKTSVVLNIKSAEGRDEPAHIHRGKACDSSVDPKPTYALHDVKNGHSLTSVDAPIAKLLSGNYVVIVHSSTANMNRYVSCGLLYH
jgi:hypothetical protein